MRFIKLFLSVIFITLITGCSKDSDHEPVTGDGILIDHTSTKLASIPSEWIVKAKEKPADTWRTTYTEVER